MRRNSENPRRAIEFVLEHPDKELRQIFERARYMMEHDHDGLTAAESGGADRFLGHRPRTILGRTADWFFYAVLVLAAVGLPAFFRSRRPGRLFVAIAMLSLLAVPLGLWGNPRFHVPVLPFMAVAAAVLLTRLRSRKMRRPGPTPAQPHEHRLPTTVRA